VEPQFKRLERQSELFAMRDSLNVTKQYQGLNQVEGSTTVEVCSVSDLP
jgi:hypothetical protein